MYLVFKSWINGKTPPLPPPHPPQKIPILHLLGKILCRSHVTSVDKVRFNRQFHIYLDVVIIMDMLGLEAPCFCSDCKIPTVPYKSPNLQLFKYISK